MKICYRTMRMILMKVRNRWMHVRTSGKTSLFSVIRFFISLKQKLSDKISQYVKPNPQLFINTDLFILLTDFCFSTYRKIFSYTILTYKLYGSIYVVMMQDYTDFLFLYVSFFLFLPSSSLLKTVSLLLPLE